MKRLALVAVLATAGCTQPITTNRELLCECFADAAYAVATTKTEVTPDDPQPAPAKCCDECKNTGKVRSGDDLSWVDCSCDKSCGCHGEKELVREVK